MCAEINPLILFLTFGKSSTLLKGVFSFLMCMIVLSAKAQIDSFGMEDVRITIDAPMTGKRSKKPSILILYALPNGNTTGHTMGKKTQPDEDWHFNIQHIRAQTKFIRQSLPGRRIFVVYLENTYKSWPLWKRNHQDFPQRIQHIVDTIRSIVDDGKNIVYLNGHSGGGSFIFGFLDGHASIPDHIQRISFLDSNYGYDTVYCKKLVTWLQSSKTNALNVFAYNDSVALYNGKPVVSEKGGTWYRSGLMMRHIGQYFPFTMIRNDSVIAYKNATNQVYFFFKTNPGRKIFHTTQVEYNGFIHSIFCGTALDSRRYKYYDGRAYEDLME